MIQGTLLGGLRCWRSCIRDSILLNLSIDWYYWWWVITCGLRGMGVGYRRNHRLDIDHDYGGPSADS
jgi:hypothetical protein